MNPINYYCYSWGNSTSGGGVFDTNLVNALRVEGAVHSHAIALFRKWSLPVWKKRIGPLTSLRAGRVNIVSHEGLYDLLDIIPVHCYIVHNYFTEFDFQNLTFINPLYRLGSEKIYRKIFSVSKRVVFLSAREKRLATERYPEFADKFLCRPPGHNESSAYFDGNRDSNIVEMPGTLDWLPKKLSNWLNVGSGLPVDGTLVRGNSVDAFISVIYDSFLSGFKLKLVEMAKHGKSIISFCDLREELVHIGFKDLPFILVKNRTELAEAIMHFRQKGDLSLESRRTCYLNGSEITWSSIAQAAFWGH
jgi:hypothetical protein